MLSHPSSPDHMLAPLFRAPLPIFSPTCTFLYKAPSALPHLHWRLPFHSTLYSSITSLTGPYGNCKVGAGVFYLSIFFCPPRLVVPIMAPSPLSLLVNKYLYCLHWRHTTVGICPKSGISETIASLRHNPNTKLSRLFCMVTQARMPGGWHACICSMGELH